MTIVLPPELENSNDCHLCTGIPFRAFRRILCGFGFGLDLLVHILLLHLNSEHVKFHHNQMVPQINSMETKKTKQKQPQKKPCYHVIMLVDYFFISFAPFSKFEPFSITCSAMALGLAFKSVTLASLPLALALACHERSGAPTN